jgi:glycosyltransferase involved in cell wall biosynthesis
VTRAFVLSASPLSQGFRDRLEELLEAEADQLTLPALRRLGPAALLRQLRQLSGRPCAIAFEDSTSQALRPVLHALAVAARPSSVEEIRADGTRARVSAGALPAELARLAAASALGAATSRASRRELRRLVGEPRLEVEPGGGGRVAYVNANLWFGVKAGGSVGHVAGVVNGLQAHGLEVDLFSAAEPVLVDDVIRYRSLDPPETLGLPLELNYPRFQRGVVRTVLREGRPPYDFVYQRLSTATFMGVEIARRLRTPLVLEYNGSEVWIARNWGRPLRYERYALDAEEASLRHAHLVVTVSRVLRDELLERGVPEGRVVWYPNCVDERIFDPARFDESDRRELRARHEIPDNAVVVTFVGTFGRWHGAEVLARAIARLAESDGSWLDAHRVHFLLVGDGLRMTEVQRILGDVQRGGLVTLAGLVPQSEGPRYLAISDVAVSPHVPNEDGKPFFGSPTKLFEYMAMGKATLASALDQIGDVLTPAVSALAPPSDPPRPDEQRLAVVAEPGSVEELVSGLRFLVERADWRRTLGSNARREALARYTWRHHVRAILDALEATPGSPAS